MIEILFIVLGGLANRIRGGLWSLPSTTLGRLVPSTLMGLFLVYLTNNWYLFPIGTLSWFIGLIPGWGKWYDLGRTANEKGFWHDAAALSLRGLFILLPLVISLYGFLDILAYGVLGGLAMPLFYEPHWRLNEAGYLEETHWWRHIVGAEFLFGSFLFICIYWSIP